MEQGPDELADRGEEREEDLKRATHEPLDRQGDRADRDGEDDPEGRSSG